MDRRPKEDQGVQITKRHPSMVRFMSRQSACRVLLMGVWPTPCYGHLHQDHYSHARGPMAMQGV